MTDETFVACLKCHEACNRGHFILDCHARDTDTDTDTP